MGRVTVVVACMAFLSLLGFTHADMDLFLLDTTPDDGPACLDGSPPGYYYRAGAQRDNWVIWFQGGGWCYKETDCAERAKTDLGSSNYFTPTFDFGSMLSEDPVYNPNFYDWTHVVLPYCDGASWTGNQSDPVIVDGVPIYFRGFQNLHAVFTELQKIGLSDAKNVLLSGCSAGGLSTFLHADHIAQYIPAGAKYMASPQSGIFLMTNNAEGKPIYEDELEYVFQMQGSAAGIPQKCLDKFAPEDQWKCMFAQVLYPFIDTPLFVLNSAYDQWSLGCIYTAEPVDPDSTWNGNCSAIPKYTDCVQNAHCGLFEIAELNLEWHHKFITAWESSGAHQKAGNGAFITSCLHHCGEDWGGWNVTVIDGMTTAQALWKWWQTDGNAPASQHTYKDCVWLVNTLCNPTCNY